MKSAIRSQTLWLCGIPQISVSLREILFVGYECGTEIAAVKAHGRVARSIYFPFNQTAFSVTNMEYT